MRNSNHITTTTIAALIGLATLSACGAETDEQSSDTTSSTATSAATETVTTTSADDATSSGDTASAGEDETAGNGTSDGQEAPTDLAPGGEEGTTGAGGMNGDGNSQPVGAGQSSGAGQTPHPELASLPLADPEPYLGSRVMPQQPGYQFVSPSGVYCEMYDAPATGIRQPLAMCTERGGGDLNAVSVRLGGGSDPPQREPHFRCKR
ncbi:hypothetical protein [Corynebacterium urogenitale]